MWRLPHALMDVFATFFFIYVEIRQGSVTNEVPEERPLQLAWQAEGHTDGRRRRLRLVL